LKLIAEVGLVGFPNAGKSSFLHCISNATPKIASYPFTTLNPNIGTIVFSDKYFIKVADLPGIMEDAHKGRGLGIQFLKHIERTKILCFIIDMTSKDPYDDLLVLKNELKLYNKDLFDREFFIVANKMDLEENKFKEFKKKLKKSPWNDVEVFPISAKFKENIGPIPIYLRNILEEYKSEISS